MGSGSSGLYSGTGGGSQPYAETYHVYPKEMNKDKKDSDIYDPKTGYFKNPKAKSLQEAESNGRFLNGDTRQMELLHMLWTKKVTLFSESVIILMTAASAHRIRH